MVFVDAGTVHAIGAGVVLLETQQTCDVTFRMYDYGRPRELHVEQALRVMKTRTNAGKVKPRRIDGCARLIEERYFTVDRYDLPANGEVSVPGGMPMCLVGLNGPAHVESAVGDAVELLPGQAVVVPVSAGRVSVRSDAGAGFVSCFAND
jgi:mannose-6-phosphate isomerase